jgi:hypothetical protein
LIQLRTVRKAVEIGTSIRIYLSVRVSAWRCSCSACSAPVGLSLELSRWEIIILFAAEWLIPSPGASDEQPRRGGCNIEQWEPNVRGVFSNYCAAVLQPVGGDTLLPISRTRYGDAYNVPASIFTRLFGRVPRERYGFSYTPEFVLTVAVRVWRDHVPPSQNDIEIAVLSEDASTPP